MGGGRLRICAPVRAGQRPCTHLSRVGHAPGSPSGLKEEVPAPLSPHQRGKDVGKGRQGQRHCQQPGQQWTVSLCRTRKLRFPPARRPEPRQRHPPVPARTSGTSERQESPLGKGGTKEPQADAFETKFICFPRAQASRWGRTGQPQECERRVATLVCSPERGAPHGFRGPLAGGCRISLSSQAGLAAEKRQVRALTVPWGWETPPSAA